MKYKEINKSDKCPFGHKPEYKILVPVITVTLEELEELRKPKTKRCDKWKN